MLRCAAIIILVLAPATSLAAHPEPRLRPAIERWDTLTGAQRSTLVQALTLLRSSGARGLVRRCLRERGSELPTCIVAASFLRMTSTAVDLRQIIRDSDDPIAIAIAARTLGRWRDRHSADLLLWAMATHRGDPLATPQLLQGWLNLSPRHEARYLRWLWRIAEPGTRRLEFALRLLRRSESNKGVHAKLRRELLDALAAWRRDPTALRAPLALRVTWGLFSSPLGCRALFARAGLKMGQGKRDPLLRLLGRDRCRPFVNRRQSGAVQQGPDDRLPLPSLPERPDGTRFTPTVERWTGLLTNLGYPKQTATKRQLAARLAARQKHLRARDDWASVRVWRRLVRSARFVLKGTRDLERYHRGLEVPSSIPSTPSLQQPAWWPSSVLLTIDDGPRPKFLAPLLTALHQEKVKAVFFFVGSQLTRSWFEKHVATNAVLERVASDGHQIGFHSMNHSIRIRKHLMWRERDQITDSVNMFRELVRQTAGHPFLITTSRLPGAQGRHKSWVNAGLVSGGVGPHLHWQLGGHQWGQRTSARSIRKLARQACRRHRRGQKTRVLLHESARSARQVRAFIREIKARCPTRPGKLTRVSAP